MAVNANFLPPAGVNRLIRGFDDVKKINVSTHPRSFPVGSFLWLNKVSGRYQAEPAMVSATNVGTDFAAGTSNAGDATSVVHAGGVLAPLFLGIAAEARVPQQLNTVGNFNQSQGLSNYAMDASSPYITYYDEGIAVMPVGPNLSSTGVLTAAVDPGTLVTVDGFQNDNSVGFYDPAGQNLIDALYYLYNVGVNTSGVAGDGNSTHAADAIGVVVERAEVGSPILVVQFKSAIFAARLGGV